MYFPNISFRDLEDSIFFNNIIPEYRISKGKLYPHDISTDPMEIDSGHSNFMNARCAFLSYP